MRPNSIRDVARREMGVVFFGHTSVAMAQLCRDYSRGNATHQERSMGVP
jgi:hypothetical protein